MRRLGTTARVALVASLALAPGAALAQTTTMSSTTTSTSTTVTSTTTTTMAHPCTGQPCTDRPPDVVLSTPTAQIDADTGGYCWQLPTQPLSVCRALSVVAGYQPPILAVTEGEVVTVRFTPPVPGTPQQVSLSDDGALTPLTAGNPTTFRVDLPAGIHEGLALQVRWLQGDIRHGFRLDVRRPATPAVPSDGRQIALTG